MSAPWPDSEHIFCLDRFAKIYGKGEEPPEEIDLEAIARAYVAFVAMWHMWPVCSILPMLPM